jgi:hypothetical protein
MACYGNGFTFVFSLNDTMFRILDVFPSSDEGREAHTYLDPSITGVFIRGVLQLLVTANAVPSLSILFVPMMEAIRSFETSYFTTATRRHIQD